MTASEPQPGDRVTITGMGVFEVLGTVNQLDERAFLEDRGHDEYVLKDAASGVKKLCTREFLDDCAAADG